MLFYLSGRLAYLVTENGNRFDGIGHARTGPTFCGMVDYDPVVAGAMIVTRNDFSYVLFEFPILYI